MGHETFGRGQHGVGVFFGANAPEQAVGFQTCARAGAARGVAAVLGQQHTDVHLVGFALQIFKEAFDAIPLVVPLALPQRRTVDDPVFVLLAQLVPRRVARNAFGFCVTHEVFLRFHPRWRLDGFDGARTQGEFVVGNDQPIVHPNHTAKASAGVAGADG